MRHLTQWQVLDRVYEALGGIKWRDATAWCDPEPYRSLRYMFGLTPSLDGLHVVDMCLHSNLVAGWFVW